jgi:cobyric acid synthase
MSNNAAVTEDGREIGRAQALQARACHVAPSVHMNPILLKPQSDTGSQVIVHGRLLGKVEAGAYQYFKPQLLLSVLESFRHIREQADLVIVEGAGSASEINLRENDIANMGFARRQNDRRVSHQQVQGGPEALCLRFENAGNFHGLAFARPDRAFRGCEGAAGGRFL